MKKYKKISKYFFIIGLVLMISGITYAFFAYSKTSNDNRFVFGDIFMRFNTENQLTLTNNFPETKESARSKSDNYIDFTIEGINTYENPIYYEIDVLHGDVITGFTESNRIDDSNLMVELVDLDNDIVLVSKSFNSLNNQKIYVDTIETTELKINHNFRIRFWVKDSVLISDTEENKTYCASTYCDVLNDSDDTNDLEIFHNLFGSFKIKVWGDLTEKTNDSLTTAELTNLETTNKLIELKNMYGEDELEDYLGYTMPIYLNIGGVDTYHELRVANITEDTSLASQTASGLVIEFADIISTTYMNPATELNADGTNIGGYTDSYGRNLLNSTIYYYIPENIRSLMIDTTVVSGHGLTDTEDFTSTEKLYLFSEREIYSDNLSVDSAYSKTRHLDYYEDKNISASNYTDAIKKYQDTDTAWWLRNADVSDDIKFSCVFRTGEYASSKAKVTSGISPAFRIASVDNINTETISELTRLKSDYEDNVNISSYIGKEYPIYLNMGSSYQLNHIRIANTTKNTSLASQSASGLVIEFSDIITTYDMNTTQSNVGGWESAPLRTYLNSTIYGYLPSDLQSLIINTTVVSGHGSSDSNNFTTTDKLYFANVVEMFGVTDNTIWDSSNSSSRQFDYYANNEVSFNGTTYTNREYTKKKYNGSYGYYWLRSAAVNSPYNYNAIKDTGSELSSRGNISTLNLGVYIGVAPVFRISG